MHGPSEPSLRVEWHPLAEMAVLVEHWGELAERAIEPNVFYEPAFALAAAAVFGRDIGAGLVWSRTLPARLLGVFPARIERRRYGFPRPVLVGWTHPYAPLGVPLVDRATCGAVLSAWLDHVADSPQLPKTILLPYLPLEGPFAIALDQAVKERHGGSRMFARHARALLHPGDTRDGYLERAVSGKKRKELRRQRKRLGDRGELMTVDASCPASIAGALVDFFSLEARGWKGRARTAARCNARVTSFMETAVTALAQHGKARILRLCLDGEPIAAIIVLRSADTAWCWKIAYDETRASSSPGVQLLIEATELLLADETITATDSCATPDHPMIDHVWRERRVLADRLLHLGPGASSSGFALTCRLEDLRRRAIGLARAMRDAARAVR